MRVFYISAVVGITFAVALAEGSADLDLILYGATGCVGHFAASYLAKQPGLKWAIAGRTKEHLQAIFDNLVQEGGPSSQPEIIVAPLDGSVDPRSWVIRAKAVISAAGPFSINGGEMVVKACAENGVHYSDTSDEFYWQRWMIDRYDALAQQTGAKLTLSSGFCVLAGDLGSQLVLQSLGARKSTKVALDAWLETYNGGVSGGVRNTQNAEKQTSYPKEWADDPYVLAPNVSTGLRVDSTVEGMSYPTYVWGEGMVVENLFGPYDARLLRRTFVLLDQKVKLRVGSTTGQYSGLSGFTATHPNTYGDCPDQRTYNDGSWAYRFKATAPGRFTSKSRTVLLSGSGDPGYRFTALGLAEVGLCLAGKTAGCMKPGAAGGVYPSMRALDARTMRWRLESVGLLNQQASVASANVIFM